MFLKSLPVALHTTGWPSHLGTVGTEVFTQSFSPPEGLPYEQVKGTHQVTLVSAGLHDLCFQVMSASSFAPVFINVEVETGKSIYDYAKEAKVPAVGEGGIGTTTTTTTTTTAAATTTTAGASAAAVTDGVTQSDMSSLRALTMSLNDELGSILAEADYMKTKEAVFHAKSKDMHEAAVWWPVCQIGILIVTGFAQVRHLTKFFEKKKLV